MDRIRTWTEFDAYNGKTYKVRTLYGKNDELMFIGDDTLHRDIHPGEWGSQFDGFDPTDPESAEDLYNEIFFFTDDITFHVSDKELRKDMKRECPEYF